MLVPWRVSFSSFKGVWKIRTTKTCGDLAGRYHLGKFDPMAGNVTDKAKSGQGFEAWEYPIGRQDFNGAWSFDTG